MRIFFTFVVLAVIAVTSLKLWSVSQPAGGTGINAKNTQVRSDSGTADIGGAFTLVNQDGASVKDTDFRGKVMAVFFGFTHCPMICPTTVTSLSTAMELLGDAADDVVPVFISVDPKRDTPERMKEYLSSFDGRFVGLTGSDEQIADVVKQYKAYFSVMDPMDPKAPNEYMVDHSSYIYIMDRDGVFDALHTYKETPEILAEAIAKVVNK